MEFLLVFLPLGLLAFALLTRRGPSLASAIWLVLLSLFFYGYWDWRFVSLLVGSTLFNFALALAIHRRRERTRLAFGLVVNLGLLGWFKYAGFLAVNLTVLGIPMSAPDVVLPLAISFFTFHQIAYLMDVYRGDEPEHSLLHYALFIFFFPHLIAGPIIRHWELLPQFRQPEFRASVLNFSVGAMFLTMGLVKKVVLSMPMQEYADRVFTVAAQGDVVTLVPAWTAALCFSLQIYFDFSGYSDMAIGLARMFGVRLPVNFNSPYKATSIIEFWHRWHITLSRFLRDYLYVPLGGNRHGEGRRYLNLMAVMLLGGLWHGAAWTFVVWGGLHGLALAANHLGHRLFGRPTGRSALGNVVAWAATMVVVVVAWVLFRAPTWTAASGILSGMAGLSGIFLPEAYLTRLGVAASALQNFGFVFDASPDTIIYPTRSMLAAVFALCLWVVVLPNSQELTAHFRPVFETVEVKARLARWLYWRPGLLSGLVAGSVVAIILLLILQKPGNAFIYFQF